MDIEERIFMKLDKIEDRIGDLCLRLSALENEYKSHLEDLQKAQNKKLRRRDFTIVIIGLGIAGIEVLRTLDFI